MNELVEASLQFPTVVFTIALGIALVYWVFVLLGALEIDLLGGADHAAGAGKGLGDAFGAGKGLGDALGAAKGGAEGLKGVKVDADGGWWSGLGLGAVPVTISVSLILLIAWCGSLLAMHHVAPVVGAGWFGPVLMPVVLLAALFLAALAVRPLAPVFAFKEGKSNTDYVGHACTITTGTVDEQFGQATIEDGGTVLVIPVRCDRPGALRRGARALVIDFDPARQAYLVEPTADMLPDPDPSGTGESA